MAKYRESWIPTKPLLVVFRNSYQHCIKNAHMQTLWKLPPPTINFWNTPWLLPRFRSDYFETVHQTFQLVARRRDLKSTNLQYCVNVWDRWSSWEKSQNIVCPSVTKNNFVTISTACTVGSDCVITGRDLCSFFLKKLQRSFSKTRHTMMKTSPHILYYF